MADLRRVSSGTDNIVKVGLSDMLSSVHLQRYAPGSTLYLRLSVRFQKLPRIWGVVFGGLGMFLHTFEFSGIDIA